MASLPPRHGTPEPATQGIHAPTPPGDAILVPHPSYPLLEHLARLEGLEARPYPLVYHGAWEVDRDALRTAVTSRTCAVVVVNPNNPTGSFLSAADRTAVVGLCRERGLALIADEVFGGYTLDPSRDHGPSVLDASPDVLTFCLGGLSKAIGLPQVKLAWVAVGGPGQDVEPALASLDVILDTYLSVATPVQLALPQLFTRGRTVATQITGRVRENHATLTRLVAEQPSAGLLRAEGGWYAVVQVPATETEEALVLALLQHDHVHVHPGYFYDFPREAFLVVSLLPDPERFESAVTRVLARAAGTA